MKIFALSLIVTLCSAASLFAAQIPLANPGFETNSSALYANPDGWGPNGGWADHASFPKTSYVAELGLNFCFMSAQGTETVEQVVPQGNVFEASKIYTFSSYAIGGGNDTGEVVYQIGYTNTTGFVPLATAAFTLDGTWTETAGVQYSTGASGPELGQTIAVRFGDGVAGPPGDSDIWLDNAQLDVVPEPAALVAVTLIGLAFIRKR